MPKWFAKTGRIVCGIVLWVHLDYPALAQGYKIRTVAGSTRIGDGGSPLDAILKQPQGITVGWDGSVYVAEAAGHRIRRISDGVITTLAGTGVAGFSGDGNPASQAQLNSPYGVAADVFGNVFVADFGNARIRKIAADGTISTLAGGGELAPGGENDGKVATAIALQAPRNVIAASDGSVYFSDFNGHRVFRLATDGSLTTVAGTGEAGFSGDGGPPEKAQLHHPSGLAWNYTGLYIADSQNGVIRRIPPSGNIETFAHVTTPTGLGFDMLGTLRVADAGTGTLLKIAAEGSVSASEIPASDAALDLDASLWVTDAAAGVVRTLALDGSVQIQVGAVAVSATDGGLAKEALLQQPTSTAVDAQGNLYLAERGAHKLRKIGVDGIITSVGTGDVVLQSPTHVSLTSSGTVLVTDAGAHRVYEVSAANEAANVVVRNIAGKGTAGYSGDDGPATAAELRNPAAAVSDGNGNIYIADHGNGRIRHVDPTGAIRTLLAGLSGPRGLALDGLGGLYFSEEDAARVSRLNLATGVVEAIADGAWKLPRGVAIGFANGAPSGDIFVADTGRQQVLRVNAAGQVDVIAGTGSAGLTGDGGSAIDAQLSYPWDVTTGSDGRIYITELESGTVRRLDTELSASSSDLVVVNAASYQQSPVAAGMQVAILNTGVTSTAAGSTVVLVNSTPAEVLGIDNGVVTVLVPAGTHTNGPVEFLVATANGIVGFTQVDGSAVSPGIFADAAGQVIATNERGSISPSNPALRGSVAALLATGLGVVEFPVTATIGGVNADILSVSPSAAPGASLVSIRVPDTLAAGTHAIQLTVANAATQSGVSLLVQ
ncbi:MAG: hypothetical protein ABL967_17665 [Bryobacteraceae bacterium]